MLQENGPQRQKKLVASVKYDISILKGTKSS